MLDARYMRRIPFAKIATGIMVALLFCVAAVSGSMMLPERAHADIVGDLEVTGGVNGTDYGFESVSYTKIPRGNDESVGRQDGRQIARLAAITTPAKPTLTIYKDCTLTISNKAGVTQAATSIKINPGVHAKIILNGVNIKSSMPINIMTNSTPNNSDGATNEATGSAILNKTRLDLVLADGTSNTLYSTGYDLPDFNSESQYPAIRCGEGSILTIDDGTPNIDVEGNHITPQHGRIPTGTKYVGNDGTEHVASESGSDGSLKMLDSANAGSLMVRGGARSAAIGGGPLEYSGVMTIDGGNLEVHAHGYLYSYTESCAQGFEGAGAGIGGGHAAGVEGIIINGGVIKAYGGLHSAGIGAGCTYVGGMSGRTTYPFRDAIISLAAAHPIAGDITINGGFSEAFACMHSNAFGAACGGTNTGKTLLITGGTLLPHSGGWHPDHDRQMVFADIGGASGYVIVTGGSVNCSKSPLTGKYRFQGNDNSGRAYGNLEKTFMVGLTTVNVKSKIDSIASANGFDASQYYNADIQGWELLIDHFNKISVNTSSGKYEYQYGSPSRLDNSNLYLWLPEGINRDHTVEANFSYNVNGNEISSGVTQPPTTETNPVLREIVAFDMPGSYVSSMTKYYDGTPLPIYAIAAGDTSTYISLANPAGGLLNDPSYFSWSMQRYTSDSEDGKALGSAVAEMPSDAGTFMYRATDGQYGDKTKYPTFAVTYWGHSSEFWSHIHPIGASLTTTPMKAVTAGAHQIDKPQWTHDEADGDTLYIPFDITSGLLPNAADYGDDEESNATYAVTGDDGAVIGHRSKPTALAPTGTLQLSINGIEVPVELGGVVEYSRDDAASKGISIEKLDDMGEREHALGAFKMTKEQWIRFVNANSIVSGSDDIAKHTVSVEYVPAGTEENPANYLATASATGELDSARWDASFDMFNENGTGYVPAVASEENDGLLEFGDERKNETYEYRLVDFRGGNLDWFPVYDRTNSFGDLTFAIDNENVLTVEPDTVSDRQSEYVANPEHAGDGAKVRVLKSGHAILTTDIAETTLYNGASRQMSFSIVPDLSAKPEMTFSYDVANKTRDDGFVRVGDVIEYKAVISNSTADSVYANPTLSLRVPADVTLSKLELVNGRNPGEAITLEEGADYAVADNDDGTKTVMISSMLPLFENETSSVTMTCSANDDIEDLHHLSALSSDVTIDGKYDMSYDSFSWDERFADDDSGSTYETFSDTATPPSRHTLSYDMNGGPADKTPASVDNVYPEYVTTDGSGFVYGEDDTVWNDWRFDGWYDSKNAADAHDANGLHDFAAPLMSNEIVYAAWTPLTGTISMTVSSSNEKWTDGNDEWYAFTPAKYGIFAKDAAADDLPVATIEIDENGFSESEEVRIGDYVLRMTEDAKGYKHSESEIPATVTSDNKTEALAKEDVFEPMSGTVSVAKSYAAAFAKNNPNYPLAGAEYALAGDRESATLTTGGNGETEPVIVPLGDYTIKETNAPSGALLDENEHIVTISRDGQSEKVESTEPCVMLDVSSLPSLVKKDELGNSGSHVCGAEYRIECFASADMSGTPVWSGSMATALVRDEAVASIPDRQATNDGLGNEGLPLGTYRVTESKAPDGYYLDEEPVHVFEVVMGDDGKPVVRNVDGALEDDGIAPSRDNKLLSTSVMMKGDIEIVKTKSFYGNAGPEAGVATETLPAVGVAFDIVNGNGHRVYSIAKGDWIEDGDVMCTIETDANGIASTVPLAAQHGAKNLLPPGRYIVHEHADTTPEGYKASDDKEIIVSAERVAKVAVDNRMGTSVSIRNIDSGSKSNIKQSAMFAILDVNGQRVTVGGKDVFASDASGNLVLPGKLRTGKYEIVQLVAPEGYEHTDMHAPFSVAADDVDKTVEQTFANDAMKGTVAVTLVDSLTGAPLVESSLQVRLIAANAIVTNDGKEQAPAGTCIATLDSADGAVTFEEVYPGEYVIEPANAPAGYGKPQSISVTVEYVDEKTAPAASGTIVFAPKSAGVQIEVADNETHHLVYGEGNDSKVRIVATENIVGKDGKERYANGQTVEELVAVNGYAESTRPLYPGKYRVVQDSAPYGYALDEEGTEFEIVAQGNDDIASASVRIENVPQKGSIGVVKRDGESGKALVHDKASFTVRAEEDVVVGGDVKFERGDIVAEGIETDREGSATCNGLYVGKYSMTEDKAPRQYLVKEEPLAFEIGTEPDGNGGWTAIDVEDGEFFADAHVKLPIHAEFKDSETDKPIGPAIAVVYAKEDIVTPDGTVKHHKGDEICTIEIGEDGKGDSEPLYIGEYEVEITQMPDGYVLPEDRVDASIKVVEGDGDDSGDEPGEDSGDNPGEIKIEYVADEIEVPSDKQDSELRIEKIDSETKDAIKQAGTEFSVYAADDIVAGDGTVVYGKGEKVADKVATDGNGLAVVENLLPGRYAVYEDKAPQGYQLDEKAREVAVEYTGQDEHHTVTEMQFEDTRIPDVVIEEPPMPIIEEIVKVAESIMAKTGDGAMLAIGAAVGIAVVAASLVIARRRKNE